MGIQGLLPLLKDVHERVNLSQLSGRTYAVDGYVWLHKGAFGCAPQLVRGERTTKYVDYAMSRVRLMRHHNIEPYLVFDGGPLPAKQGTESDRKQKRDENLAMANALYAQGKHSEAREYYTKCVDITPEFAYQLIKALKAEGVRYVVAPYEADAQLAYLERNGIVDGIITEDSDLLVFGCRDVLFKMDSDGLCVRIRKERLTACKETNLVGWSEKEFRWMAMLSGCDYLPSIPGMGLKTSYKLLRRLKTVDRVLQSIRMEGTLKIPNGYQNAFEMAELAFIYQRVYCPQAEKLVYLTERAEHVEWDDLKEAYVGRDLPPEIAKGIAMGDICPITREPIKDISPWYNPAAPKHPKPVQPLQEKDTNTRRASTGSMGDLTNYFTRVPSSLASRGAGKRKEAAPELASRCRAGGSGKRRLAEDAEDARQRKRMREQDAKKVLQTEAEVADLEDVEVEAELQFQDDEMEEVETPVKTNSRFFKPTSTKPVRTRKEDVDNDKENVPTPRQRSPCPVVYQEEGYLSPLAPSSAGSFSACHLSSPVHDTTIKKVDTDDDCGIDISSPASGSGRAPWQRPNGRRKENAVAGTPPKAGKRKNLFGVDLRGAFEPGSDIDDWPVTPENEQPVPLVKATKVKGPVRKKTTVQVTEMELEVDIEVDEMRERHQKVSAGWWAKYSLDTTTATQGLTPESFHRRPLASLSQPRSTSSIKAKPAQTRKPDHAYGSNKLDTVSQASNGTPTPSARETNIHDILLRSKSKLLQFSRVG